MLVVKVKVMKYQLNRMIKKMTGYSLTKGHPSSFQYPNNLDAKAKGQTFMNVGHPQRFFVSSVIELLKDRGHSDDLIQYLLLNYTTSNSQLWQDRLVAYMFNEQPGTFLEIGASDGVENSNTYLLEKSFNWNGLLIEPANSYWNDLKVLRNCALELGAAWQESGLKLEFEEMLDLQLSRLKLTKSLNGQSHQDIARRTYEVETITIVDALEKHKFEEIDYLSCDTEGTEYAILKNFPLQDFKVKFMSVEHNHSINEEYLDRLFAKQGYARVLRNFSNWDAWYVNSNLFNFETFKFKTYE